MKLYAIIFLLLLSACGGRESSPEGRMQIKYEALEQRIDSLANQNKTILDSLSRINQELKALKLN